MNEDDLAFLASWAPLYEGQHSTPTPQQYHTYAEEWPAHESACFIETNQDLRYIDPDTNIRSWSYVYAEAKGLGCNVPIPLHPGLVCGAFGYT